MNIQESVEFKRIESVSLKELFERQIVELILSKQLAIGEKLPPERILAAKTGVSRTVVNAGIANLVTKGFLEIRPRIGTYVADYRRFGNMETLVAIMSYEGNMLNVDEYRSFLEMRELLARESFRALVEQGDAVDLSGLEALRDRVVNAKDVEAITTASFLFYHEIAMLSNNTLIPLVYNSFRAPTLTLYRNIYAAEGPSRFKDNIVAFFDCIKTGDFEGIARRLHENTEQNIAFITAQAE